jgi:MerR family transcriptional regulator, thiopeptide resistance regulator
VSNSYRIHEFAELAGVTVKTLHHYDRIGLLKPRRTDTGYRAYVAADLERLEQIVALKFIGLPLQEIKALLERGAPSLVDALRLQRHVLEEKRRQIERAIEAIRAAETSVAGNDGHDMPVLKHLIEAITMEEHSEVLKSYFGDAAWARWKTRRWADAAREWSDLYRDIDGAIDEDIGNARAKALADRWLALVETEIGADPSVRTGLIRAWMDGHRLPALLDSTLKDVDIARATRFIAKVLWAKWEAERMAKAPTAVPHKASDSKIALFRRAEALLDRERTDPDVRALIESWDELLTREADGDPDTLERLRASLRNHRAWPEGMRRYMASLYQTTPEVWERVVDLLTGAGRGAS